MGKGSQGSAPLANGDAPLGRKLQQFTWEQVKEKTAEQKWLVIENEVYNITNWARKHPGGSKVITHYAGQDATVRKPQWSPTSHISVRYHFIFSRWSVII